MQRLIPVLLVFALVMFNLPDPAIAQTATCNSTFIVRVGDTLTEIAALCGVSYANLLAANPQITTPDWIFPGQVINIPGGVGIPPTGGDPTTYTVVSGDTMWSISRRFNITLLALTTANPHVTNINQIFPGQVLTIPGGVGIPPTGGNPTYYTVRSGDTLFRIATAYNTTVTNLLSLNPWITNANFILPGWVIRVT